MSAPSRVVDLILRWQDLREQGQAATAEEVCADTPELLDEFKRRLQDFSSLARLVGNPANVESGLGITTINDPNAPRTSRAAAPTDLPGYEVLGVLGRGGMGIVYHARQVELKRQVALKMMRAGDQADEAELARFRVEAEAVARLQHPNIVQIYEVGTHQGQPFCSLEFVGGGTLAERLGGMPQPPRKAAELVLTLAKAIDAAHRCGIVHRDLKPGNVLLTQEGAPKITDFGLAKRLDADDGQTRTGAIMGTPAYMAPEQATGLKEVGPLADVYALGAILYEMLTARPPFKGATVLDTLEQVRLRDPVPARLLQPRVPRDLETICIKCLQKEPRKRYASAAALGEDLECWLRGEPILARRSSAWERAYRWARRNPTVAALCALLAAALVAGFAGIAWQLRQTGAALDTANTNLYFQRINLAYREAQAGNTDRADVLLELCPPVLRHWEWHYLKRRCHADWRKLSGHTDLVRCVTYNADGSRLASCGNDCTVRIWDAARGTELLKLMGHHSWVGTVVLHHDGRRLVSGGENGNVKVWDALNGKELRSFEFGLGLVALSPNGEVFAIQDNHKVRTYDVDTGRPIATIPGTNNSHNRAIALGRDGRRVAASIDDYLHIFDARTGAPIHRLQHLLLGSFSMTFSADGTCLYVAYPGERYPTLKGWNATTGVELAHNLSTPQTTFALGLSEEGRQIATAGHDCTVKIRDTKTGKNLHTMRNFPNSAVSLAFNPTGRALAIASGRAIWQRVWERQEQRGPVTLQGGAADGLFLSVRPDGNAVAACNGQGLVHVCDAQSGASLFVLGEVSYRCNVAAYSPDGRRLLAIDRNDKVHVWEAANGDLVSTIRVPGMALDAAFDPTHQLIATAGDDRVVRVWDAATGRELLACHGHEAGVLSVEFSADGRRLASAGSDGSVRLWHVATGEALLTLRGHDSHVQAVAFHPSGRMLASASFDETVRLWDLTAGKEIVTLQGHTGPVRTLAFSPDGQRLASASEDGTVCLWDVSTGQEAMTLPEHGHVRRLAFTPDGRRLITATSNGRIYVWDATPMELGS